MYIIRDRHYSEDQIQEMMDRKNRYYSDLIKNMGPKDLVPGGRELLQEIRQAGIKIAIASASKNCRTVLESLQITDMLDGIADGYSVVNGKPAPDLFVYAAGTVRVPVVDCLGVEDADAGVESRSRFERQPVAQPGVEFGPVDVPRCQAGLEPAQPAESLLQRLMPPAAPALTSLPVAGGRLGIRLHPRPGALSPRALSTHGRHHHADLRPLGHGQGTGRPRGRAEPLHPFRREIADVFSRSG